MNRQKLFLLNPFPLSSRLKELQGQLTWFHSSPRPARNEDFLFLKSSQPDKVMLQNPEIFCFLVLGTPHSNMLLQRTRT